MHAHPMQASKLAYASKQAYLTVQHSLGYRQLPFSSRSSYIVFLVCSAFVRQGNGEPQLGSVLDMPDNSAAGDVWNPPDTESTMGISFDGSDGVDDEARGMRPVMQVYYTTQSTHTHTHTHTPVRLPRLMF